MQEAVLVEVEVAHQCWCIELSEKFKDTSLTGIPTHAERANSIAHMFIVHTPEVEKVLEFIKSHPATTIIKVIKKTEDTAIVFVEQPKNSLFVSAATNFGAIMTEPSYTNEGIDHVNLLFKNEKNIKSMFSELAEDYDIELKSKKIIPVDELSLETYQTAGFFKFQTASNLLSARQKEIFSLACKRGYFEIPKKITLEELSKEIGIDHRTVADHLRKAQSKLSPVISDILKMF